MSLFTKVVNAIAQSFTGGPDALVCLPCLVEKLQFLVTISNITIEGDDEYKMKVMRDLYQIYRTPTGKAMLESLKASGKNTTIKLGDADLNGNGMTYPRDTARDRFKNADGTNGDGTDSIVKYDPDRTSTGGNDPWDTRPPAVGLAHELVHAEQAQHGAMSKEQDENDARGTQKDVRELEAAGIPPHDDYPYNENKIRREWDPPQPNRDWY